MSLAKYASTLVGFLATMAKVLRCYQYTVPVADLQEKDMLSGLSKSLFAEHVTQRFALRDVLSKKTFG
jgi:hypothetical protein